MRCGRFRVEAVLAAGLLWVSLAGLARAEVECACLAPEARAEVDRRAAECPADLPKALRRDFYGGLAALTVARVPLPAEEEYRRATEVHERLVAAAEVVETPPLAGEVFASLVAEVPEHLAPWDGGYRLAVLDRPGERAWTVGGGYVYVARDYLESLTRHEAGARDRLAFVLAVETGHNAREHCRRGYQLLALQEEVEAHAVRRIDRTALREVVGQCVRLTDEIVSHLYDRQQVEEADLFALQLCGNAGFDVEAGLDVLRGEVVHGAGGQAAALQRLKVLRAELDGVIDSDAYGLLALDRESGAWAKVADGGLRGVGRGVVFVHGLKSNLGTWDALRDHLLGDEEARELPLFAFYYPGDGSLARSGRFLQRELARTGADASRFDFVCHSAGGLVVRHYVEVERGPLRQAIFLGTPHGGSDLARLRPLLELKQIVGDFDLGYSESLERAILDGNGQIAHDLHPDSLFLRGLARGEGDPTESTVFRGQVIGRKRAAALRAGLVAARVTLRRLLDEEGVQGRLRLGAEQWVDRLRLPAEIARGDLAVSLESAALGGAARTVTCRLNHMELTRDPAVLRGVTALVLDREFPDEAFEAERESRFGLGRLLRID